MSKSVPVVYILHGDDEYAITQFMNSFQAKLEDSGMAVMNITHLDSNIHSFEEIQSAVSVVPFLAERRIVFLKNPLSRLNDSNTQKRFINLLENTPVSTAFVLVENKPLTSEKDRRHGAFHWLEAWAESNRERVFIKEFPIPKGGQMIRWIIDQARSSGGEFSPRGAAKLAELVGEDTRLANLEIDKLLAYVNYQRPVDVEDVEKLTALIPEGDIFAMVDSLADQNEKAAMVMLHRLLETQDPISIFSMVVRQFRLMLLARDVMDRGGDPADLIREYDINQRLHPFVADKTFNQAKHFNIHLLKKAYRRLLEMDEAIKMGRIQGDLALDMLVVSFTSQKEI